MGKKWTADHKREEEMEETRREMKVCSVSLTLSKNGMGYLEIGDLIYLFALKNSRKNQRGIFFRSDTFLNSKLSLARKMKFSIL